jgi:hypothetical protein
LTITPFGSYHPIHCDNNRFHRGQEQIQHNGDEDNPVT